MLRPVLKVVFLLLVLFALAPVALAQPNGVCHAIEVPGPIILPDNTLEQAGRLEICLSRMYSPVAGFHRTSIDGRVSGLFVSRKVTESTPSGDDRPQFTFSRFPDGTYELESYALSDGERMVTFEMRSESVRSHWHVRHARLDRPDLLETTHVVMPATMTVGL